MSNPDWRTRVLTDEELRQLLANSGALEGMQILEAQLSLRSQTHEDSAEAREDLSRDVDLQLTEAIQIPVEEVLELEAPSVPAAVETPVTPATPPVTATAGAPSASVNDVVANLNALYATRQHVTFGEATAVERETEVVQAPEEPHPLTTNVDTAETPVLEPHPAAAAENHTYSPVPLEANTNSFFIPTFDNPLPNTQSVEVVTPMAQPLDPAKVSHKDAATKAAEDLAAVLASTDDSLPTPPGIVLETTEQWGNETADFADIPSAEEAITAFEEDDTTSTPQPDLVDQVILSVGGGIDQPGLDLGFEKPESLPSIPAMPELTTDDDMVSPLGSAPVGAEEEVVFVRTRAAAATREGGNEKSGLLRLIAVWNGSGNLLLLLAAGFVAGLLKFSLITTAVGAFGALVVTGFGFGTAALAAKRGNQPQATLSRAAFGVRGAAIPLAVVTLARYCAAAIMTVGFAFAVAWFFPALPMTTSVAKGAGFDTFYLVAAGFLVLAGLAAMLGGALRHTASVIVFAVSGVAIVSLLVAAAVVHPSVFRTGTLNSTEALALASAIFIIVSVIWGTSAADETPAIAGSVHPAKLLASGLLSHGIIGSLAVTAGFGFEALNLNNAFVGVAFILLAALALSHQIRRTADSFAGFGLFGTRWWVVVVSLILVGVAVFSLHLLVPQATLPADTLSLLPVLGVPVIAWLAAFGVDTLLRQDDYHEVSLLRDYGFYGRVRWVVLAGWILASAIGLGFVESSVPGFGWLGYIARPLGFSVSGMRSDSGVWIAFAIGVLIPLATIGIIKNQELEGRALADRHKELVNVLGEL